MHAYGSYEDRWRDGDERESRCDRCLGGGYIGRSPDWYCDCERGDALREIDAMHREAIAHEAMTVAHEAALTEDASRAAERQRDAVTP